MSDYHAFIANCLIGGEHFSEIGGHQVRNLIRIRLDRFDVELVQRPEFIVGNQDYRHHRIHTTDFYIRNLALQDFAEAELLSRDVAELLSFVTVSDVVCFGYEFADANPTTLLRDYVGETQRFRPVLDTRNGAAVRQFLESTLPTFRQLRDVRQLPIAIGYCLLSEKEGLPIELQLIALFVLLENLKHTFAHQRGYSFIQGYFRKPPVIATSNPSVFTAIRRAIRGIFRKAGARLNFEKLLREMFISVDMAPRLKPIIALRNELIHSGISQMNMPEKWAMLSTIQDVVREYFLRLWNYRGEYFAFSDQTSNRL